MAGVIVLTDYVEINGVAYKMQVGYINVSTATTTELVAASAGKEIIVTALSVSAGGDQTATFKSATTGLGGAWTFKEGGGWDCDRRFPNHVFRTTAGEAFNVTTSAAVQLSGSFNYVVA